MSFVSEPAESAVVVGAAVVHRGRVLAQQRSYPAEAAGMWELPGGRVEPGEAETRAVRRECEEELAVDVVVGARVGADVALPGGFVFRAYAAKLRAPDACPRPVEHRAVRWLGPAELAEVEWLPADRELLPDLVRLLAAGPVPEP